MRAPDRGTPAGRAVIVPVPSRDRSAPAADSTVEVRRQYRREADRYDRRWAEYLRGTLPPTLAALGPAPPGFLLDVGCGTGILLQEVARRHPGARVVGVDASPEMLRVARERLGGGVPLLRGNAHCLPLASRSFDAVVTSSALHHWADPEGALGEIARVVRPGGRLVVTDWCADYLPLRVFSSLLRVRDPSHQRSYTVARLRRILESAGFRVMEDRRYRVGWLWGMMTLTAERAS